MLFCDKHYYYLNEPIKIHINIPKLNKSFITEVNIYDFDNNIIIKKKM